MARLPMTILFLVISTILFADTPAALSSAPTESRIKLRSGISIEYVEAGSQTGTPVVLLHGLSDSWHSYELILPELPPSLHAFAISQRGHGDSDRPKAGYLPKDFARDVAAFLDARKIKRAIVVGHSLGSYVAQRFAVDFPERTTALVLIGSFDSVKGNAAVEELMGVLKEFKDPVDRAWVKDFQVGTSAQTLPPAYLETVVEESMKLPARVWKDSVEGMQMGDHSGRLQSIRVPTLIVAGAKDTLFPQAVQKKLNAAIPNSKLLTYADAGHNVHWEEPERFAKDLTAFVEEVAKGK